MALKTGKRLVLVKTETTYGVDASPAEADALAVRNLDLSPMEMDTAQRELIRPYKGNSESIPAGTHTKLSFEIELAGSGAAGTVPRYGRLLEACGMGETVNAGTSVVYAPISDNEKSVTIVCNVDGVVHKLVGARGTVVINLEARAIPVMKFDFTGLYVAVADGAAPTPSYAAQAKPLTVSGVNTVGFEIHGFTDAVVRSLSVDLGNTVQYRALIGAEDVQIPDRKTRGSLSMEATTVAAHDWWSSVQSITTGAMEVTHGIVAGNKVTIAAPAVQLVSPKYQDADGIAMMNLDLVFVPVSGNDELTITVH